MPIGIKTIELTEGSSSEMRIGRKNIDGKSHGLLILKKDQQARLGVKLFESTKNKQATTAKIKWVFGALEENNQWNWVSWSSGDKLPLGIDGQMVDDYATSARVRVDTDGGKLNIGRLYWLEAFVINPELPEASSPKGIYIVFIDSPKITKSTFTKINVLRQTEDEVGEGQIFDYGEILKIDIYTHLIISRDDIKINCSLGGKELDFKRIMHPTFVDDVKYNAVTSLQLHIDPKWRDEVSHGENEVKDLVVSVEIETLEQKKERQMQPSVVKIDKTRVARPMVFPPISEPDLVSNYGEDELKVSYSFQVNYSGNRELITDRNKGIEQMVSILDTKVVQLQDDKPCRYTSILVYELDKESKETRRFIAFSENGNGTVNDSTTTVYCITAGHNENKKDVKIKVGGLKTEACIAYEQEHDVKGIFETFKQKANQQWLTTDQYEIKKNEVLLHLTFPYLLRDDLGWLLKYIWMPNIQPMSYFIPVQSCAYPTQGVRVDVYPDIKWQINFSYGTKNPAFYRDSWVKMTQWRVDDAVTKAQAADIEGYDGSLYMKFNLALSAKWDGSNDAVEFTVKYVAQLKKFLGIFLKAKKIVDQITYAEQGAKAKKGIGIPAKFLARLKRKPVTLEIYYPKFIISATWEYRVSENNYSAYIAPEGKIGFNPLIGGKGTLDLIALSQNIPVAGQVIKALDIAASLVNIDPVFELAAIGEVNLDIEVKPNTKSDRNDYSISLNGKLGLRIELSIKASGEVDAIIFKADFALEAMGVAESYIEPRVKGGNDENGIYVEAAMDFTGVKVTLSIKAEGNIGVLGGNRSKKRDFVLVESKPDIIKGKHYIIKS